MPEPGPEVSGAANIVADILRDALDQLTAYFDCIRCAADRNMAGAAAYEAALVTPLRLLNEALDEAEFVAEALADEANFVAAVRAEDPS